MEKINKKIGIFILNYNGLKWIKKNLHNIILNSPQATITIIDNNSHDSSIEYVKSTFPSVNIVEHRKNYGFAKGYNKVLLKNVDLDYFVIMNNDIMVTKNWINPILDLITKQNIGIVQPKIMNSQQREYFDYAGGAGGFIDILGIPFCKGRIMNNMEKDSGQYQKNTNIFWASGCCFMIDRFLFQDLNGFDEDFFMHQEEIDLCWRAQSLNKEIYYCAESTIYHHGGGTLQVNNPTKHYYNHRNSLFLLLKNMNIKLLILILPTRLIMDYIISISYFLLAVFYLFFNTSKHKEKDNKTQWINTWKTSLSILKAHLSFCLLLPFFLKKRMPINGKYIYPRSIIFDYYVNKNHTFSQLKKF
tara:strand:- start:153 stop:1229 length:1077 start_codon:yes stop_codon:yes gene_type:complete